MSFRKGTVSLSPSISLSARLLLLIRLLLFTYRHLTLALSYSFNFEEYIDENKISSSVISSQEILSDETKNWLKDMLPMLERNIVDLV